MLINGILIHLFAAIFRSKPAHEGITFLTGSSGQIQICLVRLTSGGGHSVHDPSNGIAVCSPLCIDDNVFRRHGCRNLCTPASENITNLIRRGRMTFMHCCIVIIFCTLNHLAIHNPSYGILADFPLGVERYTADILQDVPRCICHTATIRLGVPANKMIACQLKLIFAHGMCIRCLIRGVCAILNIPQVIKCFPFHCARATIGVVANRGVVYPFAIVVVIQGCTLLNTYRRLYICSICIAQQRIYNRDAYIFTFIVLIRVLIKLICSCLRSIRFKLYNTRTGAGRSIFIFD